MSDNPVLSRRNPIIGSTEAAVVCLLNSAIGSVLSLLAPLGQLNRSANQQMTLDDDRWHQLRGGYKDLYDARPALQRLISGTEVEATWHELWQELHHQGDVGEASYAVVTMLADIYQSKLVTDWNLFSLAALIEVARHRRTNPPIPDWLRGDYRRAWKTLLDLAIRSLREELDADTVQAALAVIAIGKNVLKLGALINWLDSSELDEIIDDKLLWHELYTDGVAE